MAPLAHAGTDLDDLSWLTGDALGEGVHARRTTLNGLPSTDVIDRGIMSVEEVNFTFDM